MNTTHKVSIGGMAFVVDNSAYEELKSYTDKLHRQFSHRSDGDEIVGDIESRIAELLNSKLLTSDQVVTLADVRDVISRIGDPSELDEGAEKAGGDQPSAAPTNRSRRLYRSQDNKVIGGVCGGLGAYFNMDPVLFRIAFVGLTILGAPVAVGWFFLLAYIVLWIATPLAVTVGQKLEMEGKNVNPSNIEQKLREEANNLAPHVKTFGESVVSVLGVIVKVFAIFFATIFVAGGLVTSALLLLSLFGIDPWIMANITPFDNDADFALFSVVYSFFPHLFWFKLSLFVLAIIPTILMIILMIKLLFKSRFRTRFVVIPLVVIWVLALFASMITGVTSMKRSFGGNGSVNETIYAPASIDTLNIVYNNDIALSNDDVLISLNNCDIDDYDECDADDHGIVVGKEHRGWKHGKGISINSTSLNENAKITKNSTIYIRPLVRVEYDENIDKPEVLVRKWATGSNYNLATQTAEQIKFNAQFKGDTLFVSPAIPLKLSERVLKGIEVTVLIPKGKVFRISNEMLTTFRTYNTKRNNGVYSYDDPFEDTTGRQSVEDVDTVEVR